ncbi:uncharacterized protein CLUP02_01504 [Colletotrichum lupini]|uniref:Uncharacterized protein n=1 Tax=Colletotrichum lupini TaxID=145971 RepID=A0A9Q8SE48_9PEZI|nr:uncharacterized protein CLUP02_01504 [Colletotrichum lupini]UQC74852.1 hypothetical protein CLUP02_01504 [Colletotrichum lupini]
MLEERIRTLDLDTSPLGCSAKTKEGSRSRVGDSVTTDWYPAAASSGSSKQRHDTSRGHANYDDLHDRRGTRTRADDTLTSRMRLFESKGACSVTATSAIFCRHTPTTDWSSSGVSGYGYLGY